MKKALLVAVLLAPGVLCAQEFIAPKPERHEVVPVEPAPRPGIEGIVKDVFTKKPWQLVNPLAPASYGSGEKRVSKDFGPGTPYKSSGWIIAGVEW